MFELPRITTIVQQFSVWGIVVPLGIGLLHYKTADFNLRLFIGFLVVGFITDVSMFVIHRTAYSNHLTTIITIYSLVEAGMFFWLIWKNAKHKILVRLSAVLFWITPVLWLTLLIVRFGFLKESPGQLFDPFYSISVSFLAGFTILEIVEREEPVSHAIFWILLGMFFYCFCTFFIMGLLNTLLSQRIWVLNNVFNIITYCFYSMGLWQLRIRKA
ncbi:MAG: hypothetical protein KF856_03915 [Cyclobacteriaceae bacterium]|nr:hypothetical protein [Cyclobacteriaceae bacterium]